MFSVSSKTETHRNDASKHPKPACFPVSRVDKEVSHTINTSKQRNQPHRISTQGLGESNHLGDIARPEKYMLQNGNIAELLVNFEEESDTKVINVKAEDEIVVGRQDDCSFQLSSLVASNHHFKIYTVVIDDDHDVLVYCEDLSLNGTYYNSQLIGKGKKVLLSDGDELRIRHVGSFRFKQFLFDPPESSELHKPKRMLSNDYDMTKRILGEGGQGRVYMVVKRSTREQAACKVITGQRNRLEKYHREMEIVKQLNHPNLVQVFRMDVSDNCICITQELISGGDLISHLTSRGRLTEVEAMPIVWQILIALEYLHSLGIVHRDIKPENVLLASSNAGARIILTDFGCARYFVDKKSSRSIRMETYNIGTLSYAAPEIFKSRNGGSMAQQGYSKLVDMYSLGAIVVTVLSGIQLQRITGRAFEDIPAMRELDLARIYDDPNCPYISLEAKAFIKGLLCYQQERFDVQQARESSWLSRHAALLDNIHKKAIAGWNSRSREVTINRWFQNPQNDDSEAYMHPRLRDDPDQDNCLSKCTSTLRATSIKDPNEQTSDHNSAHAKLPNLTQMSSHISIQDVLLEPDDFIIHEDQTIQSLIDTSAPPDVLNELKSTTLPEQSTLGLRLESNAPTVSPVVNHVQRREKRQRRYETVSSDDEIEQENDEELAKSTYEWVTAKEAEDKRRKIISVLHAKKTIHVALEQKGDLKSPLR